jgi:hypothetical protein
MKSLDQERFGNRTYTYRLGVKDSSLMSVFFNFTYVVGPAYIRNELLTFTKLSGAGFQCISFACDSKFYTAALFAVFNV